VLERHLLFRLGGGELGLPDGERKPPARGARPGNRGFYALGTAIGGVAAPSLFGLLVGSGERGAVFLGYLLGAALMIAAAGVEMAIGIRAERQPLESVARPLSAIE